MNLLIDFLNIKDWTVESILDLFKSSGLRFTIDGYKRGYEISFFSKGFPDRWFFLESNNSAYNSFFKSGCDVVAPENTEKYRELFEYLKITQKEWIGEIRRTSIEGPNLEVLNEIMKNSRFEMVSDINNPWNITPKYCRDDQKTIEDWLWLDYLQAFIDRQGDLFKKVRVCKNPGCYKWFVYNRPKQLFCCDDCRRKYHNDININSGYMAAHQKKKRDAGHPSYYR